MNYRLALSVRRGKWFADLAPGLFVAAGLLIPAVSDARPRRTQNSANAMVQNGGAAPGSQAPASPPRATTVPAAGAAPGVPDTTSGKPPATTVPAAGAAPGVPASGAAATQSPAAGAAPGVPVTTASNGTGPVAAGAGPGVPPGGIAASDTALPPGGIGVAMAPGGGGAQSADESATNGVAVVAPQSPVEQEALALSSSAMREYRAGRNRVAEKKLRQAISLCLKDGCSVPFRARLNRDLGVVYVGGMRHVEEGKDEFATAITADSTVAIPEALNTRAVNKAFLDVKHSMSSEGATPEVPVAATTKTNSRTKPRAKASEEPFDEQANAEASTNWRAVANWFSFGVQQDFMVHSATQYACNSGSRYSCFDAANVPQDYTQQQTMVVANGNEISASGLRLASTRLLVGYDRLLSKNFAIGVKAGAVVSGVAMRLASDPKPFFRFHAEARLTLYPGSDPFSPHRHVRPYLFLSGGAAESDSKIPVQVVFTSGQSAQIAAWKRSGRGFVGGGLGMMFPVSQGSGPFVEARFQRMLEMPALVGAAMLGWAVGF